MEHVEEQDLTTYDVDHVLQHFESEGFTRRSDRPCVFGHAPDGCYIIVIYEEIDDNTVLPVTAYEIEERQSIR